MRPLPAPPSDADRTTAPEAVDEIIDLTDRRRVLIRTVFGVTVSPAAADAVFEAVAPLSPPR